MPINSKFEDYLDNFFLCTSCVEVKADILIHDFATMSNKQTFNKKIKYTSIKNCCSKSLNVKCMFVFTSCIKIVWVYTMIQ